MIRDWRLWAVLAGLMAAGWLMAVRANRSLIVAYQHPQVQTRFVQAKQKKNDVVMKWVTVIRYLPGGTTEVSQTKELTDRSQTDLRTSSDTVSRPVLTPFLAHSRLIWVGWSVPERMPALGANLRLLGPFWVGGWVRPSTSWDYGPAVMVTF